MPKGMSEHHHTLDPIFGPVPIPGHQAGEGVVVLSIGNSIKKSIRMILDASFQKKCVYIYIYIYIKCAQVACVETSNFGGS